MHEFDQAVEAVMTALEDARRRRLRGLSMPPHCVVMRNRYSGNLINSFYFETEANALEFMRLLRRAHYAGTSQTDYTLTRRTNT